MFVVPLVSLVGLWAFAASITVPSAISDHNYNVNSVALTGPAISTLTLDLPVEPPGTRRARSLSPDAISVLNSLV